MGSWVLAWASWTHPLLNSMGGYERGLLPSGHTQCK